METLARVFDHMSRSRDTRRYATDALSAFVLEHLPDPHELAGRGTSVGP